MLNFTSLGVKSDNNVLRSVKKVLSAAKMSLCYRKKIPFHYRQLLEKLNIQRCCGEFCDVTVVIQRMRFSCHRNILSAASKKLQILITTLKPKSSRKHGRRADELHIQEISPQGFKIVLEYIYTGSLWIPEDCLTDVTNAANYLEMGDVIQACNSFNSAENLNGKLCNTEKENESMSVSSESDDESDSQFGVEDENVVNNLDNSSGVSVSNQIGTSKQLPVLDSSLGGILNNNCITTSSSSNNINGNIHGNDINNTHSTSSVCNTTKSENKVANLTVYNLNGCSTIGDSLSIERGGSNNYPDQDALSEISVQNEDEMIYQVASSQQGSHRRTQVSSQSDSDYNSYHNYVPPIEQTFSPRPMTAKMIASHMTVLPSMLPSQAFFQEQGQFPLDTTYYVSQPPAPPPAAQFYASNYSTQTDQSTGRDYLSNIGQQQQQQTMDETLSSAQSYGNSQIYNSMNESERTRIESYNQSNSLSISNTGGYIQGQHTASNGYNSGLDYSDNSHVYNDISDLSTGVENMHGTYSSNKLHAPSTSGNDVKLFSHSNKYTANTKNTFSEEKIEVTIPQNYVAVSKVNSAGGLKSSLSQNFITDKKANVNKLSASTTQNYICISPVSSCNDKKHNYDQSCIEAISPYNPETDITVSNQESQLHSFVAKETNSSFVNNGTTTVASTPISNPVINKKMQQIFKQHTSPNDKESLLQSNTNSRTDKDNSSSLRSGNNSSSHFSNRPAARMPPKKAGYRGIESDYNRNFNAFSNQYSENSANGNSSVAAKIVDNDNNDEYVGNSATVSNKEKTLLSDLPSHGQENVACNKGSQMQNTKWIGSGATVDNLDTQNQSKISSVTTENETAKASEVSVNFKSHHRISGSEVHYGSNVNSSERIPAPITVVSNFVTYSAPVDVKNNNSSGMHIQTKKMAASQAAKAAIQATNSSAVHVGNSSKSNPVSASQSCTNTSNANLSQFCANQPVRSSKSDFLKPHMLSATANSSNNKAHLSSQVQNEENLFGHNHNEFLSCESNGDSIHAKVNKSETTNAFPDNLPSNLRLKNHGAKKKKVPTATLR